MRTNMNDFSWNVVFDKMLAKPLINMKQFLKFGKEVVVSSKGTNAVAKFRKFPNFAPATTPVDEGVTPAATNLSSNTVTATIAQYGSYVPLTDIDEEDDAENLVQIASEKCGEQAGRTLNQITRATLDANTNVIYANSVASEDAIVSAISQNDTLEVLSALEANNVDEVTEYIPGSTNFNTTAIEPSFVGICHPHVAKDIRKLSNFFSTREYGSAKVIMDGEFGSSDDIRWVKETDCTIVPDGGGAVGSTGLRSTSASDVDVYYSYIIGKDAYGRVKLNNGNIQMIVKPLGYADELNQVMSVAWKVRYASVLLYVEKSIVFKSGATK